jgi:hypothetical protein
MKIWQGFGSEHSQNLVMIGRFSEPEDAANARRVLEDLQALVSSEIEAGRLTVGEGARRFPTALLEALKSREIYSLSRAEIDQFAYDVQVNVEDSTVVITTDESEVSGFMKILLDAEAKVEVYSAHSHEGKYGRQTRRHLARSDDDS